MEVTFASPVYLWALLAIPVLVAFYFISNKYSKEMSLKFANFVALSRITGGIGETSNVPILVIRVIALICVILSISGMTLWYFGQTANKDYILAIDSSASMMQTDFFPTRLDAAKTAASNFIDGLPIQSSIGIISFSGVSFVDQPLTKDKIVAKGAVANLSSNAVGGTDFGNAIITGANLLMPSQKARAIVLLTDGRTNIGVSPDRAIFYAINHQVSVYTVGIGSGNASKFDLGIDEEALRLIANLTGGKYFSVKDAESLNAVYSNIVTNETEGNIPIDLSFYLLLIALALLLTDWFLGSTIYRKIP